MKQELKTAFRKEMATARTRYEAGELDQAFHHFERAHIIGQQSLTRHMVSHWWMFKIGIRKSDFREISGQTTRMLAVIPGYVFGWVPKGNTGGANVSPIKPMVIPQDLAPMLADYSVAKDVWKRVFLFIALILVAALGADLKRAIDSRSLEHAWQQQAHTKVASFGSTRSLTVTPLINWHAASEELKTEPGVSYLIETDIQTILFDLGFNRLEENPSPLEWNMNKLGVSLSDIDTIFLSHAHLDHTGGSKWADAGTFSLGANQVDLSDKRIFAPVTLSYPGARVETISTPTALTTGVASTGPIARRLFVGQIDEQALVINLEGKGLVVVVGCGHQTVPKLMERLQKSFDEPVYAIVGDLHYPVPEGRLNMFGIDVQRRLASGDGIFEPINRETALSEIAALEQQLGTIMIGGHDTSNETLELFAKKFGDRFHKAEVGKSVILGTH